MFARFETLEAYRLDILGSILGIVAFSVFAFVDASPLAWGAVVSVALVSVSEPGRRAGPRPLAVVLVVLGVLSFAPRTSVVAVPADHDHLDRRAGKRRHRGQRPAPSADHARVVHGDGLRRSASCPTSASPDNPLTERAHHRGGERQRCRHRAVARAPAHVDAVEIDPILYRLGRRAAPRPSLSGSEGLRAHRGRPGVPARHGRGVRPGAVRHPGFPRRARRPVVAAAGELPASPKRP